MPLFLSTLFVAMLGAGPVETRHLKVTTSVGDKPARDGHISLFVDVEPKPLMHVYAPGQDGFIVVTLTLDKAAGFSASTAKFPKPEKVVFEPLHETQLVYSKPFRIVQEITPVKNGPLTIKGTLRYQACDDKVCFRPTTVPVEWTIK